VAYTIDPVKAAHEDCDTTVSEGADPSTLYGRGVLNADEALINAMGTTWILKAAGVAIEALVDDQAEEAAWTTYGLPWCTAYSAAYEDRARELADEVARE